MAAAHKKLEDEALKLAVRARAQLARRLIVSLDGEPDPDPERLWVIEAERRAAELVSGKVRGTPAAKVFKKARSALR